MVARAGERESLLASPSPARADKEKFPSQSEDATATLKKKNKRLTTPILRLRFSLKAGVLPLALAFP